MKPPIASRPSGSFVPAVAEPGRRRDAANRRLVRREQMPCGASVSVDQCTASGRCNRRTPARRAWRRRTAGACGLLLPLGNPGWVLAAPTPMPNAQCTTLNDNGTIYLTDLAMCRQAPVYRLPGTGARGVIESMRTRRYLANALGTVEDDRAACVLRRQWERREDIDFSIPHAWRSRCVRQSMGRLRNAKSPAREGCCALDPRPSS